MEQIGGKLYLDDEEQKLTGLASPLGPDDIDMVKLAQENANLSNEIFYLQSADDDDITSAERGYIVASSERLYQRLKVTQAVLDFWLQSENE